VKGKRIRAKWLKIGLSIPKQMMENRR